MATLKDIAERSGLSAMAVSKILNGKNLEKRTSSRQRAQMVRRIASELGYRPSLAARAMKSRSLRQIGAILLNTGAHKLHYMAAYEFVAGINERLQQDGYLLSVIRLSDLKDGLAGQRFLQESIFDGLICIGLHDSAFFEKALEASSGRCVWLDSNVWKDANCIRRDELHSGYTAASKLIEAGCRRIFWKDWVYPHYSSQERNAGVIAAIEASPGVRLVEAKDGYKKILSSMGPEGLAGLKMEFTGVVTPNHLSALEVLSDGAKLGLKPGLDYAMASCDEISDICYTWPDLARVGNWRFEYGEKAADMMMRLIGGSSTASMKIKGDWFDGGTCIIQNPSNGKGMA